MAEPAEGGLDVELGDAAEAPVRLSSSQRHPTGGSVETMASASTPSSTAKTSLSAVFGGPVACPFQLLWGNPELAKVILTVGFQMAASDIAGTIDLGPDTNQVWQMNSAARVALFDMAANVMAYLSGPLFGRFTDLVDRRIVLLVYGFITFIPTFVYWCFPLTESVLWATHVASIFAAIGRSSNVAFALSVDFTAFEDRALASGVYYCGTNFVTLLLSVLPSFLIVLYNPFGVRDWCDRHPRAVLWYQAFLVFCFVLSTLCIARPEKRGAEDEGPEGETCASSDNCIAQPSIRSCSCIYVWADMLRRLRNDERLRRLSIAAFFLSLSGTLSMGNDGQFFAQSMGLYKTQETKKFMEINLFRSLGAHVMVMPAYLLAGYIAMKAGTLKLLRRLAPLTALFAALGALMAVIRAMWYVPVVVMAQSMADLYEVPLMRLTAGVARPGRVGCGLTIVGMAGEAGNMLGHFAIFLVNTLISEARHDMGPIWLYYPLAGVVALCSLIGLCGRPKLAIGWGAAAGRSKDQFEAILAARKCARHWQRTVGQRRLATTLAAQEASQASPTELLPEGVQEKGLEDGETMDLGSHEDASDSSSEGNRDLRGGSRDLAEDGRPGAGAEFGGGRPTVCSL